jgi:hypothetical protein
VFEQHAERYQKIVCIKSREGNGLPELRFMTKIRVILTRLIQSVIVCSYFAADEETNSHIPFAGVQLHGIWNYY